MRINGSSVVIFLGALLFGADAGAWGVVGHRLIGEIAEQHLDAAIAAFAMRERRFGGLGPS